MPDLFRRSVRLALVIALCVLAACGGAPGPIVPVTATPVDAATVREWTAVGQPAGARLLRFRWLFRDERSSAGGRGSARVAPPDSLRFDVSGPLGSGAAAAAVVGDAKLWARPEDAVARLVPSYPLLWAMLGVARPPERGAALRGLRSERVTAWQYVTARDTVEYARERDRFTAEVREGGKVVGRVVTMLGDDGQPSKSTLTIPSVPARLDITYTSSAASPPFKPDAWVPREP